MSKEAIKPTEGELAILRVLWERGACTVREVYERLGLSTQYTTVLKLMQIMAQKGLVMRDESQRTHVYRPAVGEEQTQKRLVKDLLERAFGGSARKLIVAALSSKQTSKQELEQIRQLVDAYKRGGK